jgi:prolyl-tRNA synthetase
MDTYYEKVIDAYKKIYDRLGIGKETFVTFASGGAFTKFSHEFQTICDAGEDILYVNDDKTVAVNEEVLDDATKELGIDKSELKPVKSAEVGNIFKFGTEKSDTMGLKFTGRDGTQQSVYLASYGVGITRVMGVIVEKFSDDKGLVWPENVAPFKVYLVSIGDVSKEAEALYDELTAAGVSVLYDDRDARPGEKFSDADLIGIPHRVVISERLLKDDAFEYKSRTADTPEVLTKKQLLDRIV